MRSSRIRNAEEFLDLQQPGTAKLEVHFQMIQQAACPYKLPENRLPSSNKLVKAAANINHQMKWLYVDN